MNRTLILSALVAAIAAPALASTQLERQLGVEPGVYTTAELVAIKGSFDSDTGFNFPARDGAVVSSQSTGFSAGHIALAAQVGVNPADYTTAELVGIKGSFDTDTGFNVAPRGDVVSSQSVGISAGHAKLAESLGVNPADYTLNQLAQIKANGNTASSTVHCLIKEIVITTVILGSSHAEVDERPSFLAVSNSCEWGGGNQSSSK